MWGASPPVCVEDYDDPGSTPSSGTVAINIPVGTQGATWNYDGDSYPGEVSFQIYAPDGSLIMDVQGGTAPGLLPVAVCALKL